MIDSLMVYKDMFLKKIYIITFFLLLFQITSCSGDKMKETKDVSGGLNNIPLSKWNHLAQKKIYFGHQSVGYNILDGINDLMQENKQITLNIVETSDNQVFSHGVLAHSKIGKNTDPLSKIDAFETLMDSGIGSLVDIAFYKFCYVDIDAQTDIKEVFHAYRESMQRLKQKYPNVTFIHVTVPLGTSVTTWKTLIKKIMGSDSIWEYDSNIRKNEYNDLMRKEYSGKEPIFDLAEVESTYPDGRRASFSKAGRKYYCLAPEYTSDDGHLNEIGRKRVAEHLLILLVGVF